MRSLLVATLLLGALPHNATAAVIDADKHGFTLVNEVTVSASRADAWIAAVDNVANWWNADHTISGRTLSSLPHVSGAGAQVQATMPPCPVGPVNSSRPSWCARPGPQTKQVGKLWPS